MDRILTLLNEDARLTAAEIAKMLAMTEEDVKAKIRAYEKKQHHPGLQDHHRLGKDR